MTEPTEIDRLGCERFTTGSVASMIYGEPRFTNDIDIVVRLDEHQARQLSIRPLCDRYVQMPESGVRITC